MIRRAVVLCTAVCVVFVGDVHGNKRASVMVDIMVDVVMSMMHSVAMSMIGRSGLVLQGLSMDAVNLASVCNALLLVCDGNDESV